MSIASGYALHLYCDASERMTRADRYATHGFKPGAQAEFYDEEKSACLKAARAAGWKFSLRTGKAFCPECVAKGITK